MPLIIDISSGQMTLLLPLRFDRFVVSRSAVRTRCFLLFKRQSVSDLHFKMPPKKKLKPWKDQTLMASLFSAGKFSKSNKLNESVKCTGPG